MKTAAKQKVEQIKKHMNRKKVLEEIAEEDKELLKKLE
jgi:hypothetical protein